MKYLFTIYYKFSVINIFTNVIMAQPPLLIFQLLQYICARDKTFPIFRYFLYK